IQCGVGTPAARDRMADAVRPGDSSAAHAGDSSRTVRRHLRSAGEARSTQRRRRELVPDEPDVSDRAAETVFAVEVVVSAEDVNVRRGEQAAIRDDRAGAAYRDLTHGLPSPVR